MSDDEFYEATKYTFLGPDPYIPEVPRLTAAETSSSENRPKKEQVPVETSSTSPRKWGVYIILVAILAIEIISLIIS